MMEIVNVAQTAGMDIGKMAIGAIGTAAVFLVKWGPALKRIEQAGVNIIEHLKKDAPAVEAVQDAQQAATTVDPQLRDALLNKAVREALEACKVEAVGLGETYRDGIIAYAQSTLPDVMKPLVPQFLDVTLQAIQTGNLAAMNHPAIQAVKTLKTAQVQTAPVVTHAPVVV